MKKVIIVASARKLLAALWNMSPLASSSRGCDERCLTTKTQQLLKSTRT